MAFRSSGVVAGGQGSNSLLPVLGRRKIFFCLKNCPKKENMKLKNPILEKFRRKIAILSKHNLLCLKFAVVCRKKLSTFCPAYFFHPRRFCPAVNQIIFSLIVPQFFFT